MGLATAQCVDLLITGAHALDVHGGRSIAEPLAIAQGRVVGFGDYPARETLHLPGRVLLPGFCEGHIHLESSLLSPAEFARAAIVHGTTTVVADPHEICNVLGLAGARYLLEHSPRRLLDLYLMAPSCVPATRLETSGAELDPGAVAEMLSWPEVLGLGEVMNFPGVLAGQADVLAKIAAAGERPVDGHAPGLRGRDLMAYVAAGPDSDHECTTLEEATEKLSAGMWIMIRQGSASRDLAALHPLLSSPGRHRCLLVSDDLCAHDLLHHGHLDNLLREAVALGVAPLEAVRAVSINVCQRFGLRRRGALVPGSQADVVAVRDLERFAVDTVVKQGRVVVWDGQATDAVTEPPDYLPGPPPPRELSPELFRVAAGVPANAVTARVIVAQQRQIVTGSDLATLTVRDGAVQPDARRDLLKLAVIERHGRNGNVGLGFVHGFGLKSGALASTVAHDAHNLIVVGCSDQAMLQAARAVLAMGGGQAVSDGERVVAQLPLPLGGLMSDLAIAEVAQCGQELQSAAAGLGCSLSHAFMTLSFMALPVIPALKLTDHGLVDVSAFATVPLVVGPA